jgi:hypothetical protein
MIVINWSAVQMANVLFFIKLEKMTELDSGLSSIIDANNTASSMVGNMLNPPRVNNLSQ